MYKRPIAYVCTPDAGNTAKNANKARKYSKTVYDHGYTPMIPHLLFSQFLDEHIPEERDEVMRMNRVLIRKSRIMFVCGDEITDDMKSEMLYAKRIGLTVVPLDGIVQVEKYLKGEC